MLQLGVKNVAPNLLAQAKAASIITFGSPSAVKAWVSLVGLEHASMKVSSASASDCCIPPPCPIPASGHVHAVTLRSVFALVPHRLVRVRQLGWRGFIIRVHRGLRVGQNQCSKLSKSMGSISSRQNCFQHSVSKPWQGVLHTLDPGMELLVTAMCAKVRSSLFWHQSTPPARVFI